MANRLRLCIALSLVSGLAGCNTTLDSRQVTVSGSRLDLLPQSTLDALKRWWRAPSTIPGDARSHDVLLQVEATTPWRSISALVRGLNAAGAGRVGVVVAVKAPSPPVPKSRLTAAGNEG